ncbi:hypothetical protein [Nocardioides sp. SYSU D00065]|uniref:hypothetical protein n=1 Tax=Nocardioides sp. SYSU D00065 TaxID=2817378 RepID=UPI001B340F86|nr:hypothetical protein [Nocardioides sp. SYSU D00065]
MPANPWELRADVAPLEVAATRWEEVATQMSRRGDEIVDAARRATEGWDAAAAERYEEHRREVLAQLDRFTTQAALVAGCLRAISAILISTQKELDQAWTKVAMVPHEVVGESRHLVFHAAADDERGKVAQGQQEVEEIRRRLALSLDQESARLRSARAELVTVRTELTTLTGRAVPSGLVPGAEESGVGIVPAASTSVPGTPQVGVGALPPLAAPAAVSVPALPGLSAAALTPVASIAATAASGRLSRAAAAARPSGAVPPIGAMGAGAMGARAGAMSRGMPGGRGGSGRLAVPRLEGAEDDAARAARLAREEEAAKQAEKEAKRAALEEKRAERAARRAERESERAAGRGGEGRAGKDARRRAGITVVHYAPGEEPEGPRR